jgi:hypothetical protein
MDYRLEERNGIIFVHLDVDEHVKPKDLDFHMEDGVLRVHARQPIDIAYDYGTLHRDEDLFGYVPLPQDADLDHMQTHRAHGHLDLVIPRMA